MLITAQNLLRSGRRHSFLTHPDLRGRGHGRAVVQAALTHAWASDCHRCSASCPCPSNWHGAALAHGRVWRSVFRREHGRQNAKCLRRVARVFAPYVMAGAETGAEIVSTLIPERKKKPVSE